MACGARGMSADIPSFNSVRILTNMLYDEPAVIAAVNTLQDHCLRHGVLMRWGTTPPTPSFQRHVREYYEPFCRDAIASFLAVGFAPFRLRKEGSRTVPELLPLGTYTWTVARNPQAKRPRQADGERGPMHNPPLRRTVLRSHWSSRPSRSFRHPRLPP